MTRGPVNTQIVMHIHADIVQLAVRNSFYKCCSVNDHASFYMTFFYTYMYTDQSHLLF